MQSTERWLPVVGYEGLYEVSSAGRVRSVDRIGGRGRRYRGKLLQPAYSRDRLAVNLTRDGVGKTHRVHLLVLEAFRGPRPAPDMHGCHRDDDPENNTLENLRWDTRSSNEQDKLRNGNNPNARKTHCLRGHPFDSVNTMTVPSRPEHRRCRTCHETRNRERSSHVCS